MEQNKTEVGPAVPATEPTVSPATDRPVKPAKEPFQSKLDSKDLTIGESQVYQAVSMFIGALLRFAKERKYTNRLIHRLENNDAGNPLTPYVKTVADIADEIAKQVNRDPEFQAGMEAAERRIFMENMMPGMVG